MIAAGKCDDYLPPALLSGSGNSYKLALMLTLCRQEFDGRWLITCKGFHLEAE